MPKSREILVSVDIEADGPIPGVYSMLSLGAARVDGAGKDFYVELQPVSTQFVPEALAVSGLDREVLARTGVEPGEAMRRFRQWLSQSHARRCWRGWTRIRSTHSTMRASRPRSSGESWQTPRQLAQRRGAADSVSGLRLSYR
jgi:hypothetical protein